MNSLPTAPGFYWWRATPQHEWRMLQLLDFGDNRLMSYDVEKQSFSGRSLIDWAEWFPIGYWVVIPKPDGSR